MFTREFLTTEEVVNRYRGMISYGTLCNWRSLGQGPAYLKAGKIVLYPTDSLLEWEERNMKIKPKNKAGKDGRGMESNT